MMAIRIADRLGGGTQTETSWRTEEFKKRIKKVLEKPFSISDLKISGTDVMEILQIKPGPKVGEILNTLFQEVLEDTSKNNREYLTEKIKIIS
jgi:tRNA nucleotidyltransferase/poly(A) polymerase